MVSSGVLAAASAALLIALLPALFRRGWLVHYFQPYKHWEERGAKSVVEAWWPLPVPEPAGLGEELLALPRRVLTPEEKDQLHRDGVLVLHGVLTAEVARTLRDGLRPHGDGFKFPAYDPRPWKYNGAMRAFVRDGPVPEILGSAFDGRALAWTESPVWGFNIGHPDPPATAPHVCHTVHADDVALGGRRGEPRLISMWLPLTEAPHAIEFFRGSHRYASEIHEACTSHQVLGNEAEANGRVLDAACMEAFAEKTLRPELGYDPILAVNLTPGDAAIFMGWVMHRGCQTLGKERIAISPRMVLTTRTWTRDHDGCTEPGAFPRSADATACFDEEPWLLFPGMGQSSPTIPPWMIDLFRWYGSHV